VGNPFGSQDLDWTVKGVKPLQCCYMVNGDNNVIEVTELACVDMLNGRRGVRRQPSTFTRVTTTVIQTI